MVSLILFQLYNPWLHILLNHLFLSLTTHHNTAVKQRISAVRCVRSACHTVIHHLTHDPSGQKRGTVAGPSWPDSVTKGILI